jgi:hypothetical protein
MLREPEREMRLPPTSACSWLQDLQTGNNVFITRPVSIDLKIGIAPTPRIAMQLRAFILV